MKVDAVFSALSAARAAHLRWVARAEALVAGLPLDKEQVPVLQTDCQFGTWYYGDGQILKKLPSFQAIEEPHTLLHRIYMQIFQLLFGEDERSALSKLFGSSRSHRRKQLQQAGEMLPNLRAQSEILLRCLDLLEQDMKKAVARRAASRGGRPVKSESIEIDTLTAALSELYESSAAL